MNRMQLLIVENNSKYLPKIKELSRKNSSTLGFLPEGAFNYYAEKKQIIAAIDFYDNCIGYLLYRKSGLKIMIVHLCVNQSERNKGIAHKLLDFVIKKTKNEMFYGIGLHCRRDYNIDKMWKKLGFTPIGDKPGRSKSGKLLTYWWYDYGHPTLFSKDIDKIEKTKRIVVLDANVYFNLVDRNGNVDPLYEECESLHADWLKSEIELYLTQEISHEINRDGNNERRTKCYKNLNYYNILRTYNKRKEINKLANSIKTFFKAPLTESDESDIQHLTHTIVAGCQIFVTLDPELLKLSSEIFEKHNIIIVRPSELIIQLDELKRKLEYQPARLAGTRLKIKLSKPNEVNYLANIFTESNKKEKGNEFKKRLHKYFSNPNIYEVETILDGTETKALIVIDRNNDEIMDIPLIRVKWNSLSKTLQEHLILKCIMESSKENRTITKISDPYLSESMVDVLQDMLFDYYRKEWLKVNLRSILSLKEVVVKLNLLANRFAVYKKFLDNLVNELRNIFSQDKKNVNDLLKLEYKLWPLKLIEIDIPVYIVPIKPYWAMNLFDEEMGKKDLFGSKLTLAINRENVYYRSSKPGNYSSPARILWYISSDGEYDKTMQLSACSLLSEVKIDKPKELFREFHKLGIYEWKDVYRLSKNNINNNIMIFRFKNTEIFSKSISWTELKGILNRNAPIQSPVKINKEIFKKIYKIGLDI